MCHQARKKCCSLQQRVAAIFSSAEAFFFCACQYIWINNSQRYATPNLNKISTEISTRRQSGACEIHVATRRTRHRREADIYMHLFFLYAVASHIRGSPLFHERTHSTRAASRRGHSPNGCARGNSSWVAKKLSHEYAGLFSAGPRQPNKLITIKANK